MALIKCEECGKEISENAVSCPNCGAKNKNNKDGASSGVKAICFFFPIIGFIIFAVNVSTRHEYADDCLWASILGIIIVPFVSWIIISIFASIVSNMVI